MFSIRTTVDGVLNSDDVEPRMPLVHYPGWGARAR